MAFSHANIINNDNFSISKKQFIYEYVIARASTITDGINVMAVAKDAEKVYDAYLADKEKA